jgi:hypothetical protein
MSRIYMIANAQGRDIAGNELPARLVRAANASQALRHVVADTLAVALASQDDLVRLLGKGVRVEAVNTEDETGSTTAA